MQASLDHIDRHSRQLATYWFKPEGYFRFVPGEFTELYLPHSDPDNRGASREFTISSTPRDTLVGITTTFPTDGQKISTFKRALQNLAIGDIVQLAETKGDFVAPRDSSIPLLFVAGGIGITPVLSIVSHLKNQNDQRAITILHSAADTETFLGKTLFTNYSADYIPTLTSRDVSWQGKIGRIHTVDILATTTPRTLIYISGPDAMTATLRKQLIANGVQSTNIVTDAFTGY